MGDNVGTSATASKNKWNKENLDHYHLTLPKGKKSEYMQAAKALDYGELSKLIVAAVDEKLEREGMSINEPG